MADLNDALRELGVDGFIRFSIREKNLPVHAKTHEDFKGFCKESCGDNYTVGLRILLDNYKLTQSYDWLFNNLANHEERIKALEDKPKEEVKEEKKETDEEVF